MTQLKFFDDFPSVGKSPFFDLLFDRGTSNYPPYNLIKTADGFLLEMAATGYDKEDLEVSFENRLLKIKGKKRGLDDETGAEYIYQGLSTKAFERTFSVGKDLEIGGVFLENGLLCIDFYKTEPAKPNLLTIE